MPRSPLLRFAVALAILLGAPCMARAHAPNIASFELVPADRDTWRLDVHMTTSGMHAVMRELHPDETLSAIPLERYEQYVVDALLAGISLDSDAGELVLGQATPSIGAHQSDVSFVVELPEAHPTEVHAHITALTEHPHQHNVFRVRAGGHGEHVVLDEDNEYRGHLSIPQPEVPAGLGVAVLVAADTIRVLRRFHSTLGTLGG